MDSDSDTVSLSDSDTFNENHLVVGGARRMDEMSLASLKARAGVREVATPRREFRETRWWGGGGMAWSTPFNRLSMFKPK